MFKILILAAQNTVSDACMKFLIRDRLSWLRFLGFDLGAATPDENTIRLFREKLTRAGAIDSLFTAFDRSLRERGYRSSAGPMEGEGARRSAAAALRGSQSRGNAERRRGRAGGALRALTDGREVIEDYRNLQLSLRAHPLTFVRDELTRRGVTRCADLAGVRDGRHVEVAGIILVRQKPGSAKGVLFITIEDETGIANGMQIICACGRTMNMPAADILGRFKGDGEVSSKVIRLRCRGCGRRGHASVSSIPISGDRPSAVADRQR